MLEELALIGIVELELCEILIKVMDVFDDLLQDIVRSLCSMMLQGGALAPQKLHFLLVVVQTLDRFFRVSLQ